MGRTTVGTLISKQRSLNLLFLLRRNISRPVVTLPVGVDKRLDLHTMAPVLSREIVGLMTLWSVDEDRRSMNGKKDMRVIGEGFVRDDVPDGTAKRLARAAATGRMQVAAICVTHPFLRFSATVIDQGREPGGEVQHQEEEARHR
jgi:hypothetical protein